MAGRLLADGLGGAVVCWRLLLLSEAGRLLAFLGAEEARREGRAAVVGGAVGGGQSAGLMVCRGWMGRAMVRRRSAAAIRMYLISN